MCVFIIGFRVVQALPFNALRFEDVSGECGGGLDKLRLGSVESRRVGRDLCLQSSTPSSADELSLSRLLDVRSVMMSFCRLPTVLRGGRRIASGSHEVRKGRVKSKEEGGA